MAKLTSKVVNKEKQLLKLIDISKYFIENITGAIDYLKITGDMLELSNAKYVNFNLYDNNRKTVTTVAISGSQDHLKRATDILGFNPLGMKWNEDKVKNEKIRNCNVFEYNSLCDLTNDVIPKDNIKIIEENFEIGQVIIVKIMKDNTSLGDFTIFMSKNNLFESKEIVELYASQVGLYIEKMNLEINNLCSKKKLENIIEGTNAGTWEWNVQTGETVYNERWAEIVGYTLEEISPTSFETWKEIMHPDDFEESSNYLNEIFDKSKEYYSMKCRLKHKAGYWVWALDRGKVVSWTDDDKPLLMLGTILDISEIEHMQNEIKKSEDNFRTLVESSYDIIFRVSLEGKITFVSKACNLLLGYKEEEVLGNSVVKFVHQDYIEKTKVFFDKIKKINLRHELKDIKLKHKDGTSHWFTATAIAILDESNNVIGITGTARDCNEEKIKQKQVEYLSFHDHLTGLYNRLYMEDAIMRLDNARNMPFAIMCLDVNALKLTNDAFGHEKGDELLIAVAEIISKSCRADDIICRVGGDEFVILLSNTDASHADSIKKRIKESSYKTKLDTVIVSLAIGYAIKEDKNQNIKEIQKLADNNMYKDKLKHGKAMRGKTIETVLNNINNKYDKEQIHTERTSQFCEGIAKAMNLSAKEIEEAKISGIVHDVGKIIIPTEILNKKGKLTLEELEVIKKHPVTSYQILKSVDEYSSLAEAVLYHHERVDGMGYPEQLSGEEIPLLSKIIAVADAYEAMTSNRDYKKIKSKEEAIKELKKCSGSQFDPEIVKVFVEKVL